MRTLFLKKIDFFAQLAPTTFNFSKPSTASRQKTCIIRPGGLGDLVVMTRACRDLGLALEDFDWIVECRNASWLKYLSIPYLRYDNAAELRQIIGRYGSYQRVIVSEQYHGLATILAQFLASRDGEVIGFGSNPRAKVFSKKSY